MSTESIQDQVKTVDCGRRRLIFATAGVGGVATVAAAVPFMASLAPSERARSAGAPVEADISKLAPGQMMTVEWRGKPVWIIRRTQKMLDDLKTLDGKMVDPQSAKPQQPLYAKNATRSLKPELLVVIGICTHLGCSPSSKFEEGAASGLGADWKGGFLCPCHGSLFDLAGRVYKNMPAPDNLEVPPYRYLSDAKIVIGEDTKGA
jgi:ubiquinol-cytochrome c reductase iron-sulfur subunit